MMGVAGILGGALMCAIHGATVQNTLYEDASITQMERFRVPHIRAFDPTQRRRNLL